MPTPRTKKQIYVKVTNGESGDIVVIQNQTQGWRKEVTLQGVDAIYNPATDNNTVAASDTINVYVNGRLVANGSGTISGGGVDIDITGTVDVISQAVNL